MRPEGSSPRLKYKRFTPAQRGAAGKGEDGYVLLQQAQGPAGRLKNPVSRRQTWTVSHRPGNTYRRGRARRIAGNRDAAGSGRKPGKRHAEAGPEETWKPEKRKRAGKREKKPETREQPGPGGVERFRPERGETSAGEAGEKPPEEKEKRPSPRTDAGTKKERKRIL